MKKTTLLFAFVILTAFSTYGQATLVLNAPVSDGSTTGNRAPNGTSAHSFMRAASLVLTSELSSIPASTSLTSFGLVTNSGANVAVTGTLTVYMQNSADATFTKGTTWSTIITGMTQVYSGTYTVPASATNIDLTLTTPFTYTGGSVYVAYDFVRTGTAATTAASYQANSTGLTGGCVSAASATAAPTTLGTTSFRPVMRFGYANPNSNDMSVESITTLGNVASVLGLPVTVSAIVKNKSNTTLNNVTVNAAMTGANTYTDTQTVATIAPGATVTVNFANWTPTALGTNTLNVNVPADQVNTNNSLNFSNSVNCNTLGAAQNPVTYTSGVGFNTGSGIICTPLQTSVATTITDVNVAISNNTASVGNNVYAVVMNSAGAILGTSTNTLTIGNADLSSIKTFNFSPAVAVAANQLVYYGLAQTANATTGYFPLGAYINNYLNTSYYTTAITGGTLTLLTTNLGQMGLEVNVTGTCNLGVESVGGFDKNISIFPNPATTVLNIKLKSVNDTASLEVYNAIGQMVIPSQKINNSNFELNVSSLTKGVYFLKVTNDKEISNVKFSVDR